MASCPVGMSVSDCATISTAAGTDITSLVYDVNPTVSPVLTNVYPPLLQSNLTTCDGEPTCKLVSYDFINDKSVRSSDSPYVLNTQNTTARDIGTLQKSKDVSVSSITSNTKTLTVTTSSAHGFEVGGTVILKNREYQINTIPSTTVFTVNTYDVLSQQDSPTVTYVPPTLVFSGVPGYEQSYGELTGTVSKTIVANEEQCAEQCNTDASACKAFSINPSTNACEIIPTFSVTTNDSFDKLFFYKTPLLGRIIMSGGYVSSNMLPDLNLDDAGKHCQGSVVACNSQISLAIAKLSPTGLSGFSTRTIDACNKCPPRSITYYNSSPYLTYEFGVAISVTVNSAYSKMMYTDQGRDTYSYSLNELKKAAKLQVQFNIDPFLPYLNNTSFTRPTDFTNITLSNAFVQMQTVAAPFPPIVSSFAIKKSNGTFMMYDDGSGNNVCITVTHYQAGNYGGGGSSYTTTECSPTTLKTSSYKFRPCSFVDSGFYISYEKTSTGEIFYKTWNGSSYVDVLTTPESQDTYTQEHFAYIFFLGPPGLSCPIGSYLYGTPNSCQPCELGYYCPKRNTLIPLDCPMGYYCPLATSTPFPCTAGYYCPSKNLSSQTICPAGSYCPEISTNPVLCPVGTINPSTGQTSVLACTTCPIGTYALNHLECRDPAAHFHHPNLEYGIWGDGSGVYFPGGTDFYVDCPIGTYCPAGKNTSPTPCPMGTYSDGPSRMFCFTCPFGTYNSSLGSSSASACQPCPAGTYCPQGSGVTTTCPAGYYCPDGSTKTACPAHTYSSATGQTSVSTCSSCPSGTQFLGSAGTSSSVCVACIGGYTSTAGNPCCPSGYTSANKQCSGTISCPSGTTLTSSGVCASSSVTPQCETSGDTFTNGQCTRTSQITYTTANCPWGTFNGTNACILTYTAADCPSSGVSGINPYLSGVLCVIDIPNMSTFPNCPTGSTFTATNSIGGTCSNYQVPYCTGSDILDWDPTSNYKCLRTVNGLVNYTFNGAVSKYAYLLICPNGSLPNASLQCIYSVSPSLAYCPSGYNYTTTQSQCPYGNYLTSSNKCCPDGSTFIPAANYTQVNRCCSSYVDSSNRCKQSQGSSVIVPTSPATNPIPTYGCQNIQTCTTGTCLLGTFTSGICSGGTPVCPVGYYGQQGMLNGKCQTWTWPASTNCPIGYSYVSSGSIWTGATGSHCEADPVCPAGSTIDVATNLCKTSYASCATGKITCATGYYYDTVSQKCILPLMCPSSEYSRSGSTCTSRGSLCTPGDPGTYSSYIDGTCTLKSCITTDVHGTANSDINGVCRKRCIGGYSKDASGSCSIQCPNANEIGTTAVYTDGTCQVFSCTTTDSNGETYPNNTPLSTGSQDVQIAKLDIGTSDSPFSVTPTLSSPPNYTVSMDIKILQTHTTWRIIFGSTNGTDWVNNAPAPNTRRPLVGIHGTDGSPANRIFINHVNASNQWQGQSTNFSASLGSWFNFTFSINSTTNKGILYVNGIKDSEFTGTGFVWSNPATWTWNNSVYTKNGSVFVQNVKFWDKVLTDSEVSTTSNRCTLICNPGYGKNASGACTACTAGEAGTTPTYSSGTCTVTSCSTATSGTATVNPVTGLCMLTCLPGFLKTATGCTASCPRDPGATVEYLTGCTLQTCTPDDSTSTSTYTDASGYCRATCNRDYAPDQSGICKACAVGDPGTIAIYSPGTCTVTGCQALDINMFVSIVGGVCRLQCLNGYIKDASGQCQKCPTVGESQPDAVYDDGTCTLLTCGSIDFGYLYYDTSTNLCRIYCDPGFKKKNGKCVLNTSSR